MKLRARGWSILRAAQEVGASRTSGNNWSRGYKTYRNGTVTLVLATVVAVIASTVIVIVCGVLCLARMAMKDASVPDRIKILKSVLDALVTLGRRPHQHSRYVPGRGEGLNKTVPAVLRR